MRKAERDLLVAFDAETGRESLRRVHVLDEIVRSERGGEGPAGSSVTGRRTVSRPARWADVTEAVPDRSFTYDQ